MGKTHKNVQSGSQSVDYQSSHSRTLLEIKKRSARRKIRTHNKQCDEDNIISMKNINFKIKDHWASEYIGKLENVPNMSTYGVSFDNKLKCVDNSDFLERKWNKTGSVNDIITKIMDSNLRDILYWKATQKQITRRGKAERFYGHDKENYYRQVENF